MQTYTAAPFYTPPDAAQRYLPEGPLLLDQNTWPWPGPWLAWVAIQHGVASTVGAVHLLNLDTRENRAVPLPGRPGFVAETARPGMLLVGLEREIVLLDLTAEPPALHPTGLRILNHPRTIINDGLATPFGLIFGTKDLLFQDPIAHLYLYRYDDDALTPLADGQTCSNGKIIQRHADGWRLLDIDTPTRQVVAYTLDLDAGTLHRQGVVADFADLAAYPDGMRLTPDGQSAVVAFYNPDDVPFGIARQYSLETGEAEAEWRVPASPRVTCPAFIAREGRIHLLLTTAIEGMTPAQQIRHHHAGMLFLAETAFKGPLAPTPKVDVDALL